jgi:prophage antirepressor-like protein/very-short-patch-repair endonuclease
MTLSYEEEAAFARRLQERYKCHVFFNQTRRPYTLYRTKDVGTILQLKNIKVSIRDYDKSERTYVRIKTNGGEQSVSYITHSAVLMLITRCRTIPVVDVVQHMGISMTDRYYTAVETDTLKCITTTFKGHAMLHQYSVDNYRIDLYFLEHKLAIECDEHSSHFGELGQKNDATRQSYIESKLGCRFLRYRPQEQGFNMYAVLNQIYTYLHESAAPLSVSASVPLTEITQPPLSSSTNMIVEDFSHTNNHDAIQGSSDADKEAAFTRRLTERYPCHVIDNCEDDPRRWYCAKDICNILGISNLQSSLRNHDASEKRTFPVETKGGTQNKVYITYKSAQKLMSASRKEGIHEVIQYLQLPGDDQIRHRRKIEMDVLKHIQETFGGGILNHRVGRTTIDLYYPEYRLAIECAPFGTEYNKQVREDEMNRLLDEGYGDQDRVMLLVCEPHTPHFSIFKILNHVQKRIHLALSERYDIDIVEDCDVRVYQSTGTQTDFIEPIENVVVAPVTFSQADPDLVHKFDAFIDEYCIVRNDVDVSAKDIMGQYRLYAQEAVGSVTRAFTDYLKCRFKYDRLQSQCQQLTSYFGGEDENAGQIMGYQGVRLKPIEYKLKYGGAAITPPEEVFIFHCCRFTPSGTSHYQDIWREYQIWRQSIHMPPPTPADETALKTYLKECPYVLFETVWANNTSGQGYYGIVIKSHIPRRPVPCTMSRVVTKRDLNGHPLTEYATIAKAAAAENMSAPGMSRAIKHKQQFGTGELAYIYTTNKSTSA